MGVPVIAIDTGGPKVLMEHSSSIKIKPDNTNEMVNQIIEAIVRCKNDVSLRKKMSEDGIECVKHNLMYSGKYDYILNELEQK